tara:strand:- start:2726 stop:3493 length:768 start_codon:yes stop_codon:yes gene_type:complete
MFFSEKLKSFKNLSHCFFSRRNGSSSGIYKSLNCGLGSKDSKASVVKNLQKVSKYFNIKPNDLKIMNQTHSSKVLVLDEKNKFFNRFESDALITKLHKIAIGVLSADCIPILFYDKKNNVIGCVHAGWKGARSGVIENTVAKFRSLNKKNEIFSAVGPCIGKDSYEVGNEFVDLFIRDKRENSIFFNEKNNNKFYFDLRGYVNSILEKCDISGIENINMDTVKDEENFFSFRRSTLNGDKDYGRCISVILINSLN